MQDILADLNPEQKKAVTFGSGPLLIVAGAGTGKTTVITRRLAWLVLNNLAKPEEILAVTFTEKAAEEMETRVDQLLPYGYVDLWISTFHGFCEKILKQHAIEIGLPGDFKIFDETAAWRLVRQNLQRFNFDYYRPLGNPTKYIHGLLKHFSRCKDEVVFPDDYLKYARNLQLNTDNPDLLKKNANDLCSAPATQEIKRICEIADAYHTYQQLLLENNAMDFGDLINNTLKLFQQRPAILSKYQQRFKYILVDEFQDTNWAQYELTKLLSAPKNNLIVSGDDSQAIYKFRGASVSNILQFKKDYSHAAEVVLTQNYRSNQNILDLAYRFIKLNDPNTLEFQLGISKQLAAQKTGDGLIKYIHTATLGEEIQKIIEKILELKKQDKEATWDDFAILVRANREAEPIIQALEHFNLPYQFLASSGLYNKSAILDILAYLRLLDNYHETLALYRILNMPFLEIPYPDLVELNFWAKRKNWSLYETLQQAGMITKLSAETRRKIGKILQLIAKHTQLTRYSSVAKVIFAFLQDFGYEKWLVKQTGDEDPGISQKATNSLSYLNQFFKKIEAFEQTSPCRSVKDFVAEIDLEIASGEEGRLAPTYEEGPEAIKILTVHGAKGLEFPYVFIVNLIDSRFPSVERREQIELPDALVKEIVPTGDIHLQEERRLFYVAMTRAKNGLFFSSADDYGGQRKRKLSRFLTELGFEKPAIIPKKRSSIGFTPAPDEQKIAPLRKQSHAPPSYFSFTQLAGFDKCPLQYKFSHILRLPIPRKPVFIFGQTMHEVMKKFLGMAMERSQKQQTAIFPSAESTEKPLVLPSLDELIQLYQTVWCDDWFEDKKQRDAYFQSGLASLKELFKQWQTAPPRPRLLEKDFLIKLGQFALKGKIDRVDYGKNGIKIIDYKTGKARSEEDLAIEDKRQLYLYQMAAEDPHIFNTKVETLTFYYFENNTEVNFLPDDKEKEKTKIWILNTIQAIKDTDFSPTPGFYCQYCDFRQICEAREG